VFDARRTQTTSELDALCQRLIHPFQAQTAQLDVNGRHITVPWQARGIVRFTFDQLCNHEYFSADYIAIAATYHTLILTDVPRLTLEQRDRVRRFIILVDELYNAQTKFILSIEIDTVRDIFNPLKDNPCLKRDDLLTMDEFHSFDRTYSRLIEMQSKEYLAKPKRFIDRANALDSWSNLH
jgi:predicted ATPase